MDCETVGDVHPKEMVINNISSQWCNEAYMVIKLLASTSSDTSFFYFTIKVLR